MLDDDQIRERGGTEEDIAIYAHDVGYACIAEKKGECEICDRRGKFDITTKQPVFNDCW